MLAIVLALVGVPGPAQAAVLAYTSVALSASMSALAITISTSTRDFNMQATFRALTYYTLFLLPSVFYPREVLRLPGPLANAAAHTPLSLAASAHRWALGYSAALDPSAPLEIALWALALLAAASLLYRRNVSY